MYMPDYFGLKRKGSNLDYLTFFKFVLSTRVERNYSFQKIYFIY